MDSLLVTVGDARTGPGLPGRAEIAPEMVSISLPNCDKTGFLFGKCDSPGYGDCLSVTVAAPLAGCDDGAGGVAGEEKKRDGLPSMPVGSHRNFAPVGPARASRTRDFLALVLFNFLPGELRPLQSWAIRICCGLAIPIAFVFTFNRDFSQALVVGPLVRFAFELDYVYAAHFFIRQKLAISEQL
jgi:hypothetical protein